MKKAKISRKKLQAIKRFYYKNKLGGPEIAHRLGVSFSAIYKHMKTNNLPRRSYTEENNLRFKRKDPSFSVPKRLSSKNKELKIIGNMLYWAEGYQAHNACLVDFANSNPRMILLFLNFLRNVCCIDESKLRIYLYCYANQNISDLMRYWSTLTNVPKKQFTKPYIRHDFDLKKSGKMKYGLIHVRYYDKKLLELIRKWIVEYSERFA